MWVNKKPVVLCGTTPPPPFNKWHSLQFLFHLSETDRVIWAFESRIWCCNHSRWSAARALNVFHHLCFSCNIIGPRSSRAIVKNHVKRLCTTYFPECWVMDSLPSLTLVNQWITYEWRKNSSTVCKHYLLVHCWFTLLLSNRLWLTCFAEGVMLTYIKGRFNSILFWKLANIPVESQLALC